MKGKIARASFVFIATVVIFLAPLRAEGRHCSTAATAGSWDYTYTGTIFTPGGPLPAPAVGHYQQDAAGNISGGQARTVAGSSMVEEVQLPIWFRIIPVSGCSIATCLAISPQACGPGFGCCRSSENPDSNSAIRRLHHFALFFAFLGNFECYRDLDEAAGAADAAACSTSNRWGASNVQINYGS